MCGIIGYIGNDNALDKILYGLKRLEYRGYDSAGISIIDDKKLIRYRSRGRIEDLIEKIKDKKINGTLGIGHTRWATHGKPTDENAHPHIDCSGKISIVHNGIIENYFELKEKLKKKHKFSSETDTEVFAHLIEDFIKEGLENAVKKSILKIKGMYALVIISSDEPDKIVAARQGSPLVIGIGESEVFVSSDIPSFLKYTKKAIFLEDGDIAIIKKDKIRIFNNNKEVKRQIRNIKWTEKQAQKGGFPHFMLKEIMEEPQAFEDTLMGKFDERYGNIKFENIDIMKLKSIENIRIIACGTSYHAAYVAKYLFEKWTGINTQIEIGSEIRYANPVLGEKTLIIIISQSGETIDTIEAFKNIKNNAYYSIAIVNVVGSTLSRMLHGVIYTHAGPEIGVAATKTFISQLAVLYLLALCIAKLKNKINIKDIKNSLRILRKIPSLIKQILSNRRQIEKIAEKYYNHKDFLYYGRNINYPIALEGALKLKEISYIHAEGYPAGEMKHGPIALVDEKVPNVFIAPQNSLYEKVINNIEEIKARNGIIIALTNRSNNEMEKKANDIIYIPDIEEDFYPLLAIIPLQLLAYYIGVKKGIDVDKPRNLAKSVTVE
ncbi:MAG: glutamine--fructose-6-phosphate transaminase (isomerizing) [Candidatus Goldbacteria bacterium]|nr:glutamine--fructose-6-phosphate transaminase (isomerizing) [Candidatus Goldiibacteriota bacterium]